jgi:hypothetical protein
MSRKPKTGPSVKDQEALLTDAADFNSSGLEVGGTDGERMVFFSKITRRLVFGGPTVAEFLANRQARMLTKVEALRLGIYDYDGYMQGREVAIDADGNAVALAPPGP